MEKNLTTGSVLKNILFFSLPYLFSYFLQTLYGMADLFIIGQFEGVAATTAVSIGSQVMHMLTVMIVGLAMGTTVSIAQAIGANKKDDAAAATGNTVTLFLILSVCLTGALLCVIRPITMIMSVLSLTLQSALSAFLLSQHTTLSVPFSAEWVTQKVQCISSLLPVWQTSFLTTFSLDYATLVQLARHSVQLSLRLSALSFLFL